MKYIFLACITLLLYVHTADAEYASLFSNPYTNNALIAVPLSLRLVNTSLNTIEGDIAYDHEKLEFVSVQENRYIGTRWIYKPDTIQIPTLTFAITIPGGVEGTYDPLVQDIVPTNLATFYFKKKDSSDVSVTLSASVAYENSYQVPTVPVESFSKIISLANLPVQNIDFGEYGKPRIISTSLVKTASTFLKDTYTVYIQAADPSGIARILYENEGSWVESPIPFFTIAGLYKKNIAIRVENGRGLFTESMITVPASENSFAIIIITLCGLFLLLVYYIRRNKYRSRM